LPRTYSRPRDLSLEDSYTYRPSSYYERPSSYYNKSGLGSGERMRARESVRFGNIQNETVIIEDADNPGVGKTIFRAGSASEEAIIERAYPFKREVRTNDVTGVLLLITCREIL
jgi:hypothetical protein